MSYELIFEKTAFEDFANEKVITYKQVNKYVCEGVRPKIPSEYEKRKEYDGIIVLIKRCWNGKAEERPKIKEVIKILEKLIKKRVYFTVL